MFSELGKIKWEINNYRRKRIFRKLKKKKEGDPLNNLRIKEEITKELTKYLELNDSENTTQHFVRCSSSGS